MKRIIACILILMGTSSAVFAQPNYYSEAVVVKENSLWYLNLTKETSPIGLDVGTFNTPILSKTTNHVAYQDGSKNLFVATWDYEVERTKIGQRVTSYVWDESNQLLFSTEDGGLYKYSTYDSEVTDIHLDTTFKFDNMYVSNGYLYAQKYIKENPNDTGYNLPVGIVQLNLSTLNEKIMIPYQRIPESGETLGLYPVIAALSKSGDFLYVWCKPNSASMTADGVALGVYNVHSNVFSIIEDTLMLTYDDQIDVSPIQENEIVIINGRDRIMNANKILQQVNMDRINMPILSAPYTTNMTPTYSPTGQRVIYSSGVEQKDVYKPYTPGQNHIYEVNLKTHGIKQLTFGDQVFDFSPHYIAQEDIVFVRRYPSKKMDLMRRDLLGKENIIISDLYYNEYFDYYGHYAINKIMDLR